MSEESLEIVSRGYEALFLPGKVFSGPSALEPLYEVAQRYATVWTLRDGKVVKGVSYTDRAEALRSVGLSK